MSSISAAGRVKSLIESVFSMKSWSATRTMNSACGSRGLEGRSGNRRASRAGIGLASRWARSSDSICSMGIGKSGLSRSTGYRLPYVTSCRHLCSLVDRASADVLWWGPVAWGWLGLVGMYAICNTAVSLLTAFHYGWKLFLLLPLVFACYHFGYGYGFLGGLWNFAILRRGPDRAYTALTRTPTPDLSRKTTTGRENPPFSGAT